MLPEQESRNCFQLTCAVLDLWYCPLKNHALLEADSVTPSCVGFTECIFRSNYASTIYE